MQKIGIVDYDCGNMYSIMRALERLHLRGSLVNTAKDILNSDYLILPGVGSYGEGMHKLRIRELVEPLVEYVRLKKPLLGICLGMQLLVDSSEEFGFHEGLGFIPGTTRLLKPVKKEKVPHVGWNQVVLPSWQTREKWDQTILKGIDDRKDFYFVHSYFVTTHRAENTLATTSYGGCEFASVIIEDNIVGCQFHLEKSAHIGSLLIQNFFELY